MSEVHLLPKVASRPIGSFRTDELLAYVHQRLTADLDGPRPHESRMARQGVESARHWIALRDGAPAPSEG